MPKDVMKILLVCANPRGTDPLRTAEEDRTLRESIQLSANREYIEIETLNAATVDDLRRALLRKSFDIVHFSGHGTQTGLVFEDPSGKLMVPPASALAELLARRHVKVALLNACYSLSVGKITAIGLEYTIASAGAISDPGAIEFTRGFYDAVGAGTSVSDAYEEGLSAAKLKGFSLDAVFLRHGEEYVPEISKQQPTMMPRATPDASPTLLGIAIDTSGSMTESIRNSTGESLSRFGSVEAALTEIATQLQDEMLHATNDTPDLFRIFIYGFGLRIGTGAADLASLWKAAQKIDLEKEIEVRKRRYGAEGQRKAAGYQGLASLARSYGFGGLVDSVTEAAKTSARDQIVAEIGRLVVDEANRLGDSTLSAEDLSKLFHNSAVSADKRLLDHVIFGSTPMTAAATEIRDRFNRMGSDEYTQRTLLVISDGVPTDGDPRAVFEAMRNAGVNVVSCFVTDADLVDPRVVVGAPLPSWPEAARLMWDIASPLDESSSAAQYLLAQNWSIEQNARLFVQVNHSDVLKEFMRVAASYFSRNAAALLPRGH
jgi:hypothetical protein